MVYYFVHVLFFNNGMIVLMFLVLKARDHKGHTELAMSFQSYHR